MTAIAAPLPAPAPAAPAAVLRPAALAAYAALGLPLMMTALPLAILVPDFYAGATGLALSTIGLVLLATRLLDAVADPLLGAWVDRLRARGRLLGPIVLGAAVLLAGFSALFLPPAGWSGAAAAGWLALTLVGAYLGYSLAVVAYQAWGAGLAHDDGGRTRVTAAREGAGLLGVVVGGSLPALAGHPALAAVLAATLLVGLAVLAAAAPRPAPPAPAPDRSPPAPAPHPAAAAPAPHRGSSAQLAASSAPILASSAPSPASSAPVPAGALTFPDAPAPVPAAATVAPPAAGGPSTRAASPFAAFVVPLRRARSRWLLGIFATNALAPAITATVFPFFVADRLGLAPGAAALSLAAYFVAGALGMPLWMALARRWPLEGVWLAGMAAAVLAFVGAAGIGPGPGALAAFVAVCVLSGLALGADLALPPALLARVIDANRHGGTHEGAYFGLWNLVNKLCLALAGGIALPLLEELGYERGGRDPQALAALAVSYAIVPCVLKTVAAALLAVAWRQGRLGPTPQPS